MFTDLGKDWVAGPPSDYNRFIPMTYAVAVELKNYDIKTYVNDHNIIDKPLNPEENGRFPHPSPLAWVLTLLQLFSHCTVPVSRTASFSL